MKIDGFADKNKVQIKKESSPELKKPETEPKDSYIDSVADVRILHTNDMHGQLSPFPSNERKVNVGGLANLANVIKAEKEEADGKTLLLDAGDITPGSPVVNFFNGAPMLDFFKTVHYDGWELGNHEFDNGYDVLKQKVQTANEIGIPVLGANVLDSQTGENLFNIKPYITKEVNGVKIGIIGLDTPETLQTLYREEAKKYIFLSPEETAVKCIQELKEKEKPDVVVVLSHLGIEDDKELAQAVNGIDVIIGGHTHTEIDEPVKVNNTLIVQAGRSGEVLGEIDLKFDKSAKKIESFSHKLIPVIPSKIKGDEEIEKFLGVYKAKLDEIMNVPVCKSEIDLTQKDYHRYHEESTLGNFVTDAIRDETKADIGFIHTSYIRDNIPKGNLTVGYFHKAFTFTSNLVTVEMKSKDLLQLLEEGMREGPDDMGQMVISGLKVKFDSSLPVGHKILEVRTMDDKVLDLANEDKTYTVGTRDYIAEGLLGFKSFLKGKQVAKGREIKEAIMDYAKKLGVINENNVKLEGRLADVSAERNNH